MKIENGDVITLDNGQVVKVTLTPVEIVPIPGKKYRLRYTGQFCHWCTLSTTIFSYENKTTDRKDLPKYIFQYIGEVDTNTGIRAIFFCRENSSYVMFSKSYYDYIVEEVK